MIKERTEPGESPAPAISRGQSIGLAAIILALFLPVLRDIVPMWFMQEQAGHCIFIGPIAVGLLWLRRRELVDAPKEPRAAGLWIMAAGLVIEVSAYLMRVHFLEVWSFVPILAGYVYLVYGPHVWKIARFPIFLTVLLMPLPTPIFMPTSLWIRAVSTVGATGLVDVLGYPILRSGNVIQIPGMTVEVAVACSGFNKLAVLVTMALLYGYLYPIGYGRRLTLLVLVVPIAVVANIIRIVIILLASYYQGQEGFHIAHSYADFIVIAASFGLFVLVGNLLGCKTPRFAI